MLSKFARPCLAGISPYIPGKPIEEVERQYRITGVSKLASNENPLGPSPLALAAILEAAAKCHLYPDGDSFNMKRAVATMHGVSNENVIIGNGTDQILEMVAVSCISPGDEVLSSEGAFIRYRHFCQMMGGTYVQSPMKDYAFDLYAMSRKLGPRTKVVFLSNPNNPTGTIFTHEALLDFIAAVGDSALIVVDDAYREYVTDPAYPRMAEIIRKVIEGTPPFAGKKILWTRTFSKIYGLAGVRLGYGISTPDVISQFNLVRGPFNVNSLAHAAGVAALADLAHVERSIELNCEQKDFLYREYERLGLEYVKTQANFILVDMRCEAAKAFEFLLGQGVIIRPLPGYDLPQRHARISIGLERDNRKLIAALEKFYSDKGISK